MRGVSRRVCLFALGGLLLGFPGAAGAQPFGPYRQYSSNLFVNGNLKLFLQKSWGRTLAERQGSTSALAEPPSTFQVKLPLTVSSFRTVSGPVMPRRLAAAIQDINDTQRQELESAFLEMLKSYEQLLEQNDEQRLKNNLAGAFNFLFTSSYYAFRNGQELSDEQQEGMLEQINNGIALSLRDRRLSDRDKQEMYETVVLAGSIVQGLYNEGRDKGRPDQMKVARELGRDLLEQVMGITMDKVHVNGGTVRID